MHVSDLLEQIESWPVWARIIRSRLDKDKPSYIRRSRGLSTVYSLITRLEQKAHRFEEGTYFVIYASDQVDPSGRPMETYQQMVQKPDYDNVEVVDGPKDGITIAVVRQRRPVNESLATKMLLSTISKIRAKGGLVIVRLNILPLGSVLTGWLQSIEQEGIRHTVLGSQPLYVIYVTTENGGLKRLQKSEESLGTLVLKKEDYLLHGEKPVYVLTDDD